MKKTKTFLIIAVAVGLGACSEKPTERKSLPITVETETVRAGSDLVGRSYVGVVEEESATSISFTGAGTLTRMYVDEGQPVRAGQLIAELDKTQARNMLAAAEAQMKQANDALTRMQQLYDNGSLPEMKWVETQSRVEQAQAQLDLARKSLQDCSVRTPVAGIVGKKVMDAGETVLPSMPVASILNINNVRVVVSVPEKEIAHFSHQTPTSISVEALGDRIYQGGAVTKGVEADGMTHTYDIKIHLSNADHSLLPGMVCQVSVGDVEGTSQLSVPITAVQVNARGEHFVWTVSEGKAHRTIVATGRASGNRIAIDGGLVEGDEIVTEGYQKLSEGTEVKTQVQS
ncbi:MAG: efflux RND transporter periplasmic adaptor subunit [Prevotella sp.]|nr:efflux RND transporter periplasmic adaptor subunit [Prevotella sp.]